MNGTVLQAATRSIAKTPATPAINANLADSVLRGDQQAHSHDPQKGADMGPRIAELETQLNELRKHQQQLHEELKSIRNRLGFSTGIITVLIGLACWIANSRFDQLVALLN
ncbi:MULTISPECIES: hypothetical protein [Pseudomonas]|jgi:hypothetical protein|uniref:hypothetical protein n=1 Tax=Pseudomonas TaxID=286 RepID=UPI00210B43B1|nr:MULTISPECIES: hypothetical protein [Pseudomonas]WSO23058.1 hypothetical protein VUJ50_21205 [Pseudomonas fluorescens]